MNIDNVVDGSYEKVWFAYNEMARDYIAMVDLVECEFCIGVDFEKCRKAIEKIGEEMMAVFHGEAKISEDALSYLEGFSYGSF